VSLTYETIKYPPDIFAEIATLLDAHYEELCLFDNVKLAPKWDKYKVMADMGMLHVVFARNEKGELVGYTVDFVIEHMHYDFKMATNDILYMKPKYRGHGIRLIKFTENSLKKLGVDIYVMSIKPHVDFSRVIERFGYQHLESNYWRRLT
jgi:GNAT superfamily N-acetyltransferase